MIGTKISDRYEIVGELGRGGMGVVYRARDPLLDREVAIKVVPPTLLTPETEVRFQREAQIVARMDHPAIVTVYDFGHHDGSIFFVMPVVSGSTLRTLLRDRSLVLGEVVDLGILVSDALAYSHNQGVVHRDIKPENLMVWRHGDGLRLRIMDFGLARVSIESQLTRITHSGTLIGTVCYFSPEQVSATHDLDARSDLYSLGVVLYEALVGEPPFAGEVQSVLYRIVHEHVTPPSMRGVDLDPELEQIVMRCLEREASDRWASASELVSSLERYRAGLDEQERRRPVTQPSSRVTRSVLVPRVASQLVGREVELGELQHRLNASVGGECQFVVVGGEAGIGKSRLVEELERLARARRIRVLHGRFVERDRAFAYQGFCEVIQEYYRRRELSTSSSEVAELSDLASDLVALFPVLSEVGPMRSGSVEERGGQEVRRRIEDRTAIFELLARVLARLGGGQPMVLLFEDLHDADVSIEALQYIVRRLGPTPTLIVGTYRTSEVERGHALRRLIESLSGDRRFGQLVLGPLEPGEHRVLVEGLVGGGRVGEALGRALYAATEGNPFFTRELVRSLVDSGGIAEDETGVLALSSEMGLTSSQLPETIQQVVEKQVERLGEEEREVLARGALLGRTFEYRDLEALVGEKWEVEEAIERLVREGLLEEEREGRGERLTFASGVVRDVLYGGLSRRKRRTLHRRYAEYLEERYAGKLERLWGQLAHHYSQGDVGEKAVEYGLKAARKSVEAFSAEEAMRAAKTALEYLEDEEWEGERWQEGEARMLLARANRLEGNIDGALREVERAIDIFRRERLQEMTAMALLAAAEIAWQGRLIEQTRRWIEAGIGAARATNQTGTLRRLLSLGATVANLRGEYEKARLLAEEVERLQPVAANAEEVPRGGRLRVAFPQPISLTDPARIETTEEEEIIATVFERLFVTDSQGTLTPNLCASWTVRERGRLFRLTIRSGVTFSDGEPLTAPRVKRSFERAVAVRREATPAALLAIRGVKDWLAAHTEEPPVDGEAYAEIDALRVDSDEVLEIELEEPIPIFLSMLTDVSTSIAHVSETPERRGQLVGTGPFRFASPIDGAITLERVPTYWRGDRPYVDAVEFLTNLGPREIATRFRDERVDIVRGLLPEDIDRILRNPRRRVAIVEATQRNTTFFVFNTFGDLGGISELRRALSGVIHPRDLVWRSLGGFTSPATSLIPPGQLGHDPGRKHRAIDASEAQALLEAASLDAPIRLRAAVSPSFQQFSKVLLDTLFETWSEMGVEVEIVTETAEDYVAACYDATGIDLLICQWTADYDDADNFTNGLFDSQAGILRDYFHSDETDSIARQARIEDKVSVRDALYRKFENRLLDEAIIIPLLHATDYRIAHSRIRGLNLAGSAPYVDYSRIGIVPPDAAPRQREVGGGTIYVPTSGGEVRDLDPVRITTTEQAEVLPNVYETLLRVDDGAQIIPWLAASYFVEDGGRRYRFRLRENVRFHDGRQLTARDVRYSFERFFQTSAGARRSQLAIIRGAVPLIEGRAGDLAGLRIHSSFEFSIELERPLSFFNALLANPSTAIVPEGSLLTGRSWREQCVGTGPFRVTRFDPGRTIELERNPFYWREGYPKCRGLVFQFGIPPDQIAADFRAGRFSIATDISYEAFDELRHDPIFAARYLETPRLSSAFISLNIRRLPLADRELRRRIVRSLDAKAVLKRTLSRSILPACGLIPPGLPGHDATGSLAYPPQSGEDFGGLELTAAMNTVFTRRYPSFTKELIEEFGRLGIHVNVLNASLKEMDELRTSGNVDMIWSIWVADYPDTDSILQSVLHTTDGAFGVYCGTPEIDRLIDLGQRETDPAKRHAIYRQIEGTIEAEALLIPLFHSHLFRVARPEVEGLSITALTYPSVAYEKLWIR